MPKCSPRNLYTSEVRALMKHHDNSFISHIFLSPRICCHRFMKVEIVSLPKCPEQNWFNVYTNCPELLVILNLCVTFVTLLFHMLCLNSPLLLYIKKFQDLMLDVYIRKGYWKDSIYQKLLKSNLLINRIWKGLLALIYYKAVSALLPFRARLIHQ